MTGVAFRAFMLILILQTFSLCFHSNILLCCLKRDDLSCHFPLSLASSEELLPGSSTKMRVPGLPAYNQTCWFGLVVFLVKALSGEPIRLAGENLVSCIHFYLTS